MGRFKAIGMGFLLLLTLMAYPAQAATPVEDDVTIDAAEMEYDIDGKAVTASGNVVLKSENLEVRADEMVYYNTGWIEVPGKAHIKTEQGEFDGDGLRYHIPTKTGEIKHPRGHEGEYYIKGKSGTVSPQVDTLKNGTVTRCERPRPCYRLHAARIRFRNGRIIIERGYLDILGVPVFPILYLNFDADAFEDWPDINLGRDNEKGVFVTTQRSYTINPHLSANGHVTLGTNDYLKLGGGLSWYPGAGIGLSASGSREWSEDDDQAFTLKASKRLWAENGQYINMELFKDFKQTGDERVRDGTLYGLRLNYSPKKNMTMGLGWANAEGAYYGDAGWGLDSTFHWKQFIGENWRFTVDGGYHWGDGNGRWNERKVSITRFFHCISTTLSRDFQDEDQSWQISFGIRW